MQMGFFVSVAELTAGQFQELMIQLHFSHLGKHFPKANCTNNLKISKIWISVSESYATSQHSHCFEDLTL